MDEDEEAGAYMDAAAQEYLARLDACWVQEVLAVGTGDEARVLDVGTGGGQIPLSLARRRPDWKIWGIDRAPAMLAAGIDDVRSASTCVGLALADARRLPARDDTFDLVISNSLLHHLANPIEILNEMARVSRPSGKIVVRDLRRPTRRGFAWHVRWHGRHYTGTMRRLYEASVAAALTPQEMSWIVERTQLARPNVRLSGPYLVVEASGAS